MGKTILSHFWLKSNYITPLLRIDDNDPEYPDKGKNLELIMIKHEINRLCQYYMKHDIGSQSQLKTIFRLLST